jgi:hypothetical protein
MSRGNLFEYARNGMFNAANYFGYLNNVKTVDPLKRNQFGGTIGGQLRPPISERGPTACAPDVGSFGSQLYQPTPPAIQKIVADNFTIGDNPHAIFARNTYSLAFVRAS